MTMNQIRMKIILLIFAMLATSVVQTGSITDTCKQVQDKIAVFFRDHQKIIPTIILGIIAFHATQGTAKILSENQSGRIIGAFCTALMSIFSIKVMVDINKN